MIDSDVEVILASESYLRNPHPGNHRLRAEDPLHWSAHLNAWVPTRWADVRAVLHDHTHFSSRNVNRARLERVLETVPEPERSGLLSFWDFEGLFQSDLPGYRAIRTVVAKALQSKLPELQPTIGRLVDDLLVEALKDGHIDVIADVAFPLPATVIFDLLGVDLPDRSTFRRWAEALVMTFADESGHAAVASSEAMIEAFDWLSEVAADRRRNPRDDLITEIILSEEFSKLPDRDTLSTIIFFLLAGHETTANLIGNGCWALLQDPQLNGALRADPDLMPHAIEEFLRHESPIQRTARVALPGARIGDMPIPEGDVVTVMHGAANRDPEKFDNPDRCDFTRRTVGHLAFGYGPHFCVGAPLARLEGPIAFSKLLPILARSQVVSQPQWNPNPTFRGLESLHLVW